jgi:hypothetical protein
VLVAQRAQRLEQPLERRELADGLQHAAADACAPPSSRARIRVRPDSVREAEREIGELVRHLTSAAPVSPRGVAQVRMLLTDGSGPLFRRPTAGYPRSLRAELRRALDFLDPLAGGLHS